MKPSIETSLQLAALHLQSVTSNDPCEPQMKYCYICESVEHSTFDHISLLNGMIEEGKA